MGDEDNNKIEAGKENGNGVEAEFEDTDADKDERAGENDNGRESDDEEQDNYDGRKKSRIKLNKVAMPFKSQKAGKKNIEATSDEEE